MREIHPIVVAHQGEDETDLQPVTIAFQNPAHAPITLWLTSQYLDSLQHAWLNTDEAGRYNPVWIGRHCYDGYASDERRVMLRLSDILAIY